MSKGIIKIFEGIDRVGKSYTIDWLKHEYRGQGLNVVVLHEDRIETTERIKDFEFKSLAKVIPNFHEKSIFAYDAYAYLIQMMFESGVDVVLIDRLHLTTKTYADINRRTSIETVFGSFQRYYKYIKLFELQLTRIADVELFCFVKDQSDQNWEDDNENSRWKNTAERLKLINSKFYDNFSTSTLPKELFICEQTSAGHYDALTQLQQHLNINENA